MLDRRADFDDRLRDVEGKASDIGSRKRRYSAPRNNGKVRGLEMTGPRHDVERG